MEIIDDYAIYNNEITEIFIPQNVKKIGERAFGSTKLQKVVFAKNSKLEEIGSNVFENSEPVIINGDVYNELLSKL